jgi:hypothetical protein
MRFTTRCYGERVIRFVFFLHIFRILLPTQDDLKNLPLCSPLCRFTSPTPTTTTNPPLCICTLCRAYLPFPVPVLPPPRAYSKMFVGGLSWDTTDGTLSLLILPPPFFAMSCPFY